MRRLYFFLVLVLALLMFAGALSSESVNADGSSGALASAESPAEALASRRFDILMAQLSADRAQSAAERASDRADDAERHSAVLNILHAHNESLSELLGSTQTPRAAAVVDACAQRSVLHITYPKVNKTHPLENNTENGICSAFAY